MSLPIVLNTATYEVELPLSKKTVKYRPYLVKEEKLLMMAMESGDQKMILKTVQDIIDACTFGEIKSKNLPTAEMELLFLKLRTKSVGETSVVGYNCEKCGTSNELSINLEEVDITQSQIVSNKVMVTDKVGVMLKYPTVDDVTKTVNSKDSDIKNTFAVIGSCIESIFDDQNVYPTKDLEKKDVEAFIDSLNAKQFESIKSFFESVPKLTKDVDFTCSCGHHNHVKIEGLQSFFG